MNRFIDPNDLLQKNRAAADAFESDRRGFLKTAGATIAALGFWMPELAQGATMTAVGKMASGRTLRFTNVHTGEKFQGEYWVNGRYLPDAFGSIKSVLRDYRSNQQFPIDPRLMDILYVLQHRTNNYQTFDVFSGYRSPATNAKLRQISHGVAARSLHMTGQAIDINLPGTSLSNLRKTAMSLNAGGVGFYPASDFVHCDTGRVRHW